MERNKISQAHLSEESELRDSDAREENKSISDPQSPAGERVLIADYDRQARAERVPTPHWQRLPRPSDSDTPAAAAPWRLAGARELQVLYQYRQMRVGNELFSVPLHPIVIYFTDIAES